MFNQRLLCTATWHVCFKFAPERRIYSELMQWTNGACKESSAFIGTTLSQMPTTVALLTSHHFHPSLSPVVSLSLGILHEWMRTQMLAKPSSNLQPENWRWPRGGHAQLGQRIFMMTCLRWTLWYMRLEILCKIGLSADWCLSTLLHTRSGTCYYWTGLDWTWTVLLNGSVKTVSR